MSVSINSIISGTGSNINTYTHLPTGGVAPTTRNSANDATDDDEVIMATIVVPANNGAVAGTTFTLVSLWENTNSANTKTFTARINGGSIGSQNNTTNITLGQRQPWDVIDSNTISAINSFSGTGTGGNGNAPLDIPIANVGTVGFTLTLTSKWSTQPITSEFIRLKHCKLIQVNP